MKYFDNIIKNMIEAYKDPKTQYSPTHMFLSQNDLSFAISRLMDAQEVFSNESVDNVEIASELYASWISIRDDMPRQTANDIALCITKNTPLSSTQEQIEEVKNIFYKVIHTYTNNTELSNAFTNIFFGQAQTKVPNIAEY